MQTPFTGSVEGLEEVLLAQGWDVRYRQLEPGPLVGTAGGSTMGSLQMAREGFNRAMHIETTSPAEHVCVGVQMRSAAPSRVNGLVADTRTVLVLPPRSATDAITPAGIEFATLAIRPDLFARAAMDAGADDVIPAAGARAYHVEADAAASLRMLLATAQADPLRWSDDFDAPDRILVAAICASLRRRDDELMRPSAQRSAIARRVKEYLDAHLDRPLPMRALCNELGVVARTVQRAFRDVYGITPRAYHKAQRLRQVRRLLAEGDGSAATVTLAATRYGFRHLGRFAQEYRAYYGEAPSRTLLRPSARDASSHG